MSESDSDSEGPLFTDELSTNVKKRTPALSAAKRNGSVASNFGGSSSDDNSTAVRRLNGSAGAMSMTSRRDHSEGGLMA